MTNAVGEIADSLDDVRQNIQTRQPPSQSGARNRGFRIRIGQALCTLAQRCHAREARNIINAVWCDAVPSAAASASKPPAA